MAATDPRVDAYIEKSAEFARPILARLRKLFLKADKRITETIKWGVPHYEFNGIVGGFAAFKRHASFGFWKGKQMKDPAGILGGVGDSGMCSVKVSALADLPPDTVLLGYIREAVALNEKAADGSGATRRESRKAKPLRVPPDLAAALKKNAKARKTWESFSTSQRNEYVEWIVEAKRPETRERRLATTLAQLAEGKSRNWKYQQRG